MKKATILSKTTTMFTLESARLVTTVKATMPRMSSMIAAPKIALPARVFNFPISLRVSTEMLTEVAVKMIPIKMFCRKILAPGPAIASLLKKCAKANPPPSGTRTPINAITKDALPVFFSSWISVSKPAVNIRTMTPTSDNLVMKSVSCNTFNIAGPRIKPAASAPTTCGILNLRVTRPNSFVLRRISAKSNRKPYPSICRASFLHNFVISFIEYRLYPESKSLTIWRIDKYFDGIVNFLTRIPTGYNLFLDCHRMMLKLH